jgi:hypothetical protein
MRSPGPLQLWAKREGESIKTSLPMVMSMQTRVPFLVLALCCWIACADKVTVNPVIRGAAGESCTKRDDCAEGLSCFAGRCATSEKPSEEGGTVLVAGGSSGESCTWRGDCELGLACIDQTCTQDEEPAADAGGMSIQTRGSRGESCMARNDCGDELACIGGRCREADVALTVATKQCTRVNCRVEADCCKNFVAPASCPQLKLDCDAGSQFSCTSFALNCSCRQTCQDGLCGVSNKCATTAECSAALMCVNQKCVQCSVKADCVGTSAECVDGVCKTPCQRNEQCKAFHNCDAGKCMFVGCSSDRECFFAKKDPRVKCVNKECATPCGADAECNSTTAFEVCEGGRCVDVGCESDTECRARLGFNDLPISDTSTAVCQVPPAK